MTNIFGIQRPDMMHCTISEYKWGRQTLIIKMKRENSPEVQYLRFQKVEFFSGPMHWRGASFEVRPTEECLEIMQLTELIGEFAELDHIAQLGLKLYQVSLENVAVQIIAGRVSRISG